MKGIKCVFCIIMSFLLLTSCTSDKSGSKSQVSTVSEISSQIETQKSEHIFSLPYFSDDSLNPYSATQSTNFHIWPLLYETLFTLDENFEPVPNIAENASFEENIWTVNIKNGLRFSDGTQITASDVSASYSSAKTSKYFSGRLANVTSCSVKGKSVVFTLKRTDKNFIKNLNFPIIKGGSKSTLAIGSGKYVFSNPLGVSDLIINTNYFSKKPKIKSISLVEIKKYSLLSHMIKIGSVNFMYADYTDEEISTVSLKTNDVRTNQILYLGINSQNAFLANKDFRKALSLLLDRKTILTDCYASKGNVTSLPFNPYATSFASNDFKVSLTDTSSAADLLKICGFAEKNEEGIFVDENQNPTVLRLAVNSDNIIRCNAANVIKSSFEAAGIAVEIISESNEAYQNRVVSGDYDIFIGETKLTPDNDISHLLSVGNLNRCNDEGQTLTAYNSYLSGETSLDEFLLAFDLQTPFIPIMYRNSFTVYSSPIKGGGTTTEYNVLANFSDWNFE